MFDLGTKFMVDVMALLMEHNPPTPGAMLNGREYALAEIKRLQAFESAHLAALRDKKEARIVELTLTTGGQGRAEELKALSDRQLDMLLCALETDLEVTHSPE